MELFVVLFIIFVVIVGIAAAVSRKQAEQRRLALAAFATQAGLQFLPGKVEDRVPGGFWENLLSDGSNSDEGRLLHRFEGFWPFGTGHSREVENFMFGSREGLDWAIFDYSYKVTRSTGKSTTTTTYRFGIVAVRVGVALPGLTLEPENFLHRIGSHFGLKEVTFELEEFNRRYFVQASDAQAAYDVLHPQAIEFFMRQPVRKWQMAGPQILLASPGRPDVPEIMRQMQEIQDFVVLLPNYVRQDRGFTPTWEGPLDN